MELTDGHLSIGLDVWVICRVPAHKLFGKENLLFGAFSENFFKLQQRI